MRVSVLLNQAQANYYYVVSLGERNVGEGTHVSKILLDFEIKCQIFPIRKTIKIYTFINFCQLFFVV